MAEKEDSSKNPDSQDTQSSENKSTDSSGAKAKASWNHYLGTYSNIFTEELDIIKSPLDDGDALTTELKQVLESGDNLKLIYKNFKDHMSDGKTRTFPSTEELDRETIFKEKLLSVLRDNVEYFNGRRSWQSGATCFADWSKEEFEKHRGCPRN